MLRQVGARIPSRSAENLLGAYVSHTGINRKLEREPVARAPLPASDERGAPEDEGTTWGQSTPAMNESCDPNVFVPSDTRWKLDPPDDGEEANEKFSPRYCRISSRILGGPPFSW